MVQKKTYQKLAKIGQPENV